MSDECIHGFDDGLCASCFPQAAPDVARVVSNPSQRASKAREKVAPTTLRSAPVAPKGGALKPTVSLRSAPVKVGDQRIYHLTHINNLASILESGTLHADASTAWNESRPAFDMSSDGNREWRRTTRVAGEDTESIASYVPFFLSPDASVWESIRSHALDPRLTPKATNATPADFVMLVSAVKNATELHPADVAENDTAIVVTDADAALERTRFGETRDSALRLLHHVRQSADAGALLEAEFLVREEFPFEQIVLIGVSNDRVRDAVKAILKPSGYRTKVAVYPPWFLPSEESALSEA